MQAQVSRSRFLGSLALSAGLLCSLSACSDDEDSHEPLELEKSTLTRAGSPSTSDVAALGSGNRAFAFDLYHQIAEASPGSNLLFSPFSISSALAMTYAGARGTTEAEMKTALHFDLAASALHEAFNATDLALISRGQGQAGPGGAPFALHVDNQLWAQAGKPVLPAFLDTLAINYGAGLYRLNFKGDPDGARAQINGWVSDRTAARIPELLPAGSITARTRVVLTNTVYLDASWQTKFVTSETLPANFIRRDDTTVQVPMMRQTAEMQWASGEGFQAIGLSYADDALQLIAVLPDEGEFDSVEAALTESWFSALNASFAYQRVSLSLPRLDYNARADLAAALTKLGMTTAFDGGSADFSGITGSSDLFITGIFHQASLQANESGTVASAATGVVLAGKGATQLAHLSVSFERPFFLTVIDQPTGTILFLGRVLDPSTK